MIKKIYAYLAKNPITTILGLSVGVFQGAAYIPCLEPIKWELMGLSGLASGLIGIFAKDS